jgi:hypothetical protein
MLRCPSCGSPLAGMEYSETQPGATLYCESGHLCAILPGGRIRLATEYEQIVAEHQVAVISIRLQTYDRFGGGRN